MRSLPDSLFLRVGVVSRLVEFMVLGANNLLHLYMPPKFENMQNWAPEGTYTVYKYDNQIIRVLRIITMFSLC